MDNRLQHGFTPRAAGVRRTAALGRAVGVAANPNTCRNKNYGQDCGCRSGSSERSPLLRRLQELDLSLIDTGLFLDAYPTDREALDYYGRLGKERARVLAEYERQYGPMTLESAGEKDGAWDWIMRPWPWENQEGQGGLR